MHTASKVKSVKLPNNYLAGNKLEYVECFNYLGHVVARYFSDDEDIKKETRSLCMRSNLLVRNYKICTNNVKKFLFRTSCYSIYCAPPWSRFSASTLQRLKVCYNRIMRTLLGYPPRHSARAMFVGENVRSFEELLMFTCYSKKSRRKSSSNELLRTLVTSDAHVDSYMSCRRNNLL